MDMDWPHNQKTMITALPEKLFVGIYREVDGEGDRATAGGDTPHHSVERSFLAPARTPVHGLGRLCQ